MTSATALVVSAVFLASHAEAATSVTHTCKFEGGEIVIDYAEPTGRATVPIDGEVRHYVFDDQKLVAKETGLPTYYFQSELLKRWKRLNDSGETVETTVCKTGIGWSAGGSIALHNE